VLPLRARWLGWLDSPNGFIRALKQGPMLAGPGGTAFSWQDHENSALLDDATLSPERHDELVEAGVISPGQWTSALGSMGPARLGELAEAVAGALETTRALAELCAGHFDEDAPDFYNLRNALEEIHDYLAPHAGTATGPAPAAAAAGQAPAATAAAPTAARPIASREQALRALQDVGDFFRRTEPHSPISYLIARAVRWGSMPLDQLLKDVVRNDDVIDHIWETLGLDASRSSAADDED
jgi:type VI secretion system protein ImpA